MATLPVTSSQAVRFSTAGAPNDRLTVTFLDALRSAATVYYKSSQDVSAASNDGLLLPGQSLTLDRSAKWFIAASKTDGSPGSATLASSAPSETALSTTLLRVGGAGEVQFSTDHGASFTDVGLAADTCAARPDLRLSPVKAGSAWLFKLALGARTALDNIAFDNSRAATDFSLKVDSNPAGTETTFDAVTYASITPHGLEGWYGQATLATGHGVNVVADVTVTRVARNVWRKRITLTADADTTVRLRQAHGERAGEGGGFPVSYDTFNGSASLTFALSHGLPVVGYVKSGVFGKGRVAVGVVAPDGWTGQVSPSQTNVLENTNPGFQIVAINCGKSSTGTKQLALAAGVPVSLDFTYFACQFSAQRDFELAAGAARGASLGITGDAFKQIMGATSRSKLFRASDADAGIFCIPEGYETYTFTRDGFWTAIGLDDPEPGRLVLLRLAGLISSNLVPKAYVAGGGSGGYDGGDSNPLFLMWMWWLNSRFGVQDDGTSLPTGTQRNNAITGLRASINGSGYFVVDHGGGQIGAGWIDNYKPAGGVTQFTTAHMTGLACVGLMAGQKFAGTGFLPQSAIDAAKAAYRTFFNGGYLDFMRAADGSSVAGTSHIDITALAGEFFANLLFDTKLLTDAQVFGHLDAIFAKCVRTLAGGRCLANIVNADGSYVASSEWVNTDERADQGNYDNGGSWCLWDFVVCAVAKYRGYTGIDVDAFWSERRRAELAVDAVSHEYLAVENVTPVDPLGTCRPSSFGNGWNTLSATCEDLFGLKYRPVLG